jgi:hypothetical protein
MAGRATNDAQVRHDLDHAAGSEATRSRIVRIAVVEFRLEAARRMLAIRSDYG